MKAPAVFPPRRQPPRGGEKFPHPNKGPTPLDAPEQTWTWQGTLRRAVRASSAHPFPDPVREPRGRDVRAVIAQREYDLNMPIRTKRWDDEREPDDGFRLLVT